MDVMEDMDHVFAVNNTEDNQKIKQTIAVMMKTPLLLHKPKQHTHPIHTKVGGWGYGQ